ncbi:hypothetical protein ACF0H5_002387 [Mactra antiquata]
MRACLLVGIFLVVSLSEGRRRYGAPMKVPVDDPGVVKTAKWAVQQLNGDLDKILSAERQLVAGLLYTIELTMSTSNKSDQICTVKVWEKAWEKVKRRLLNSQCTTSEHSVYRV